MSDGLKWILAGLVGYWLYENYVAPQQPLQPITPYNVAPSPSPSPVVAAPPAPVSQIPQVVNAVNAIPAPQIPGYQTVIDAAGNPAYLPLPDPTPSKLVITPSGQIIDSTTGAPVPTIAPTPVGPSPTVSALISTPSRPIVAPVVSMPTFMPGAPGTVNFEAIGSGGPTDATDYGDSQGLPPSRRNML